MTVKEGFTTEDTESHRVLIETQINADFRKENIVRIIICENLR